MCCGVCWEAQMTKPIHHETKRTLTATMMTHGRWWRNAFMILEWWQGRLSGVRCP
jgi:hypothetical protein